MTQDDDLVEKIVLWFYENYDVGDVVWKDVREGAKACIAAMRTAGYVIERGTTN